MMEETIISLSEVGRNITLELKHVKAKKFVARLVIEEDKVDDSYDLHLSDFRADYGFETLTINGVEYYLQAYDDGGDYLHVALFRESDEKPVDTNGVDILEDVWV